jgi:hypothetical protein
MFLLYLVTFANFRQHSGRWIHSRFNKMVNGHIKVVPPPGKYVEIETNDKYATEASVFLIQKEDILFPELEPVNTQIRTKKAEIQSVKGFNLRLTNSYERFQFQSLVYIPLD